MTELVPGDFRRTTCPKEAVLCLVDPPYGLGKVYANEKEQVPYPDWVAAILAWSTALRTMILGPAPTLWDWLPKVPRPTRIVWWHRTFLLPRWQNWWAPSITPILVYEQEGAPWYGPRRQDRRYHDVLDATSGVGDGGRLRKVFGGAPEPKHPALTGTFIAAKIIDVTTQEGDLIVDPMCGYGSILVAAQRVGRRAWGCDIVPGYVEVARRWLEYEEALP